MHALLFGVMLLSDVSCQIMRPYIGTATKLAVMHVGRAQKYEIRNLLVKTFHLIYYMTTFLKLIVLHLMTLSLPLGRAPQYEIRNLLVKTFHLIYYMTTFLKLKFFALDDLAPPPLKGPKIWNPLTGMPHSVGRHYDDVIHPVTWLWSQCTTRWVVLWAVPLV